MRTLAKVWGSLLVWFLLAAVGIGFLKGNPGVVAQESTTSTQPAGEDFTFSVFYTGNVRGSLEPCG
jgi:hypothetical protein